MVTKKSNLDDNNDESDGQMSFDEASEGVTAGESSHRHSIKSVKATPGSQI